MVVAATKGSCILLSLRVCLVEHLKIVLLQCVAVCCSVLQCVAVLSLRVTEGLNILSWPLPSQAAALFAERVTVCCSVLQCIAERCSVAVCCSAKRATVSTASGPFCRACCSVLQCVAVCCSVLQCVAVYCSVCQRSLSSQQRF